MSRRYSNKKQGSVAECHFGPAPAFRLDTRRRVNRHHASISFTVVTGIDMPHIRVAIAVRAMAAIDCRYAFRSAISLLFRLPGAIWR